MALRKYGPVGKSHDIVVPNQVWQIDEWEADVATLLMVAGVWRHLNRAERRAMRKVRCWLTVARDVATRCVTGIHLSLDSPHAGTAVSTRLRGEPASYNVLTVGGDQLTVAVQRWADGQFVTERTARYVRGGKGWQAA